MRMPMVLLAAVVLAMPGVGLAQSMDDARDAVVSYASSVGITEEEAARRLYLQEHAGTRLAEIAERYASRLAGAYWEDTPSLHFVIRLKGAEPVAPVPSVATAKGEVPILIRTGAPDTEEELLARIKRSRGELYRSVAGLQGISVDARTGDIVLHVYSETLDRRDDSGRIPELQRLLQAPVRIEPLPGPMHRPVGPGCVAAIGGCTGATP